MSQFECPTTSMAMDVASLNGALLRHQADPLNPITTERFLSCLVNFLFNFSQPASSSSPSSSSYGAHAAVPAIIEGNGYNLVPLSEVQFHLFHQEPFILEVFAIFSLLDSLASKSAHNAKQAASATKPSISTSSLNGNSQNATSEQKIQWVFMLLQHQVGYCVKCIEVYHTTRPKYYDSLTTRKFSPEIIFNFKKSMDEWDEKRLFQQLTLLVDRFHVLSQEKEEQDKRSASSVDLTVPRISGSRSSGSNGSTGLPNGKGTMEKNITRDTSTIKEKYSYLRNLCISPLYELISWPQIISTSKRLDRIFIILLELSQRTNSLKLKGSTLIYPGIAVLSFHENAFARSWARRIIVSSFETYHIHLPSLTSLKEGEGAAVAQVISAIGLTLSQDGTAAEANKLSPTSYNFVQDKNELWKSACSVFSVISPSDMAAYLAFFGPVGALATVANSFQTVDAYSETFWDRLELLDALMENRFPAASPPSAFPLTPLQASNLLTGIFCCKEFVNISIYQVVEDIVLHRRKLGFKVLYHFFEWIHSPGADGIGKVQHDWLVPALRQVTESFRKADEFMLERLAEILVSLALTYSRLPCCVGKGLDDLALKCLGGASNSIQTPGSIKNGDILLQTVLMEDLRRISSFKPSIVAGNGEETFTIHSNVWNLISTKTLLSAHSLEALIRDIIELGFAGPITNCKVSGFNPSVSLVLSRLTVPVLCKNIKSMKLDWKQSLKLYLYNDATMQEAGLSSLQYHTQSTEPLEIFENLYKLHKENLITFTFDTLVWKLKDKMDAGYVLNLSVRKSLELFDILGTLLLSVEHPDHKDGMSLWLHLHAFIYNFWKMGLSWESSQIINFESCKSLFKLTVAQIRNYAKYRSALVNGLDYFERFHLDWVRMTLFQLQPWIKYNHNEINFLCGQLTIELLSTLKKLKIDLSKDWKRDAKLEPGFFGNTSQQEEIKRLIGDTVTPAPVSIPLKRANDPVSVSTAAKLQKLLNPRPMASSSSSNNPTTSVPVNPNQIAQGAFKIAPRPIVPHYAPYYSSNPSVPTSKLSTFEKLKQDSRAEQRALANRFQVQYHNNTQGVSLIPSPEKIEEPKERRPTKFLEPVFSKFQNRNGGTRINVPSLTNRTAQSTITLKRFYDSVLSWELNSDENLKNAEFRNVPNSFSNSIEYEKVFEPLFLQEFKSQFKQSALELNSRPFYSLELAGVRTVDFRHEMDFSIGFMDYKEENWNDACMLYITAMAPNTEPIIARVREVKKQQSTVILTCQLNLAGSRRKVGSNFTLQSKWRAQLFLNTTPPLREYTVLSKLNSLPLLWAILQPPKNLPLHTPSSKLTDLYQNKLNVNFSQAQAIARAVEQPGGFNLIQGPPGTGKTKTILALIVALRSSATIIHPPNSGNLISEKKLTKRLLICAPSNAAIDEIGRRLIKGILDLKGGFLRPNVIRVGKIKSIHPDVLEVSLDKIVDAAVALAVSSAKPLPKIKLSETLMEERATLRSQATSENDMAKEINAVTFKIKQAKLQESEELKKQQNDTDHSRVRIRYKTLLNADIILTTLSGAGHEFLGESKLEFETVIIDEACQAVELSTLIPLKYGCKKAILVGDPKQLPPTVISRKSSEYNYEQSLFERCYNNSPDSCSLLRMNPNISLFPGIQFYYGKLKDAETMARERSIGWHAKYPPFGFFDVSGGQESRNLKKSMYNMKEVRASVDLVRSMAREFPNIDFGHRIGVISFYKEQVYQLKSAFQAAFGREILNLIDINTVDGFQGQEKDIIILSCVRSSESSGVGFTSDERRINVALTRARYSLFILGDCSTMRTSSLWIALIEDADKRGVLKNFNKIELSRGSTTQNLYRAGAEASQSALVDRNVD